MYVYVDTGQFLYLDISVRQQQVDDDVNRKALHVVQTLLDSVQLGSQLHAGVKFSSFPDLVQNGFMEILAAERKKNNNSFKSGETQHKKFTCS